MDVVIEHGINDNFVVGFLNRLRNDPSLHVRFLVHTNDYISISSLTLLYLLKETYNHRVEVQISATSEKSITLFRNFGFFGENGEGIRNLPIKKIPVPAEQNPFYGIIPTWIQKLSENLPKGEITQLGEIQTICFELINNVIDHSGATSGGAFSSTYLQSKATLQIAIADFGLTIPGTLKAAFPNLELEEHEILAHALEEKVSRRLGQHHNFGMGLNVIKRYALSDGECSLKVLSGTGFLTINNKQIHCRAATQFFPGTLVLMNLSHDFLSNTRHDDEEDYAFDL